MANRRVEFSLNSLQIILLISGGLLSLVLTFALGVMVGKKDIEGLPLFDRQVKSQVVKMKVESPPAEKASPQVSHKEEKPAVMDNATSKPVITFYDTLTNLKGKGKGSSTAAVNHSETKKTQVESGISKKKYTLQVGAMKEKESADAMVSKLKKFGYSASIVSPSGGKNALYKVRIGTFSSKDDALNEADRIRKNEGLSAMVVDK